MTPKLFKRIVSQYSTLMRREAFVDRYKKEPAFSDGLGEFEEAHSVVQDLIQEYEAAEDSGYLSAGTEKAPEGQGQDTRMQQ